MIPKPLRIPKNLFNTKGVFYHGKIFTLKVSVNPQNEKTLISTSVSKKVTPSAVVRNKIRRRTYSAVTPFIIMLPKKSLLFFQAKKGAEKATFEEIKNEIEKLLHYTK